MKILTVEDNPSMLETIKEGLSEMGFAADVASDGLEGLAKAMKTDYDCILLDVMLPGIDGFEVCKRLRAAGKNTPILMLTAKDGVEDRVEGLDRGADDYLVKPFVFQELGARIRALIRRAGERATNEIICRNLSLNPITREVRVKGEIVPLRRREFDILELLMRYEGQVFSREKIIEHVWARDYDGNSNVVDVHVKYLRDRLRPYGFEELVETIRGVGYRAQCSTTE